MGPPYYWLAVLVLASIGNGYMVLLARGPSAGTTGSTSTSTRHRTAMDRTSCDVSTASHRQPYHGLQLCGRAWTAARRCLSTQKGYKMGNVFNLAAVRRSLTPLFKLFS